MKRSSSIVDKKTSTISNVVLEIGSSYVRGGIAGECVPRFVIPTPFSSLHNNILTVAEVRMNCLEGARLIFLEYLQIRSKDCNLLVIENLASNSLFREQLFNVLLNEMQVQSVCFQPDMFMPIIATGCQTGVVVDIGSAECRAICVAHGRPLLATFTASPIGVKHAARRFHRSLNASLADSGYSASVDDHFATGLFEKTAVADPSEVAADVSCEAGEGGVSVSVSVPGRLRSGCLESLVAGDSADEDSQDELGGVLGLVLACVLKSSGDVRRNVLKNIVMAGGGAQIPGLPETVCYKLTCLLNKTAESSSLACSANISSLRPLFMSSAFRGEEATLDIISLASVTSLLAKHTFPKSSLVWIGGSLFASVKMNRVEKYVTREEYLVHTRSCSSAASRSRTKQKTSSGAAAAVADETVAMMRVPDWLSTRPGDWRFYGASSSEPANRPSASGVSSAAGLGSRFSSTSGLAATSSSSSTAPATFFESLLLKKK